MFGVKKGLLALALVGGLSVQAHGEEEALLNASYDIARELFAAYNPLFVEHWQAQTGKAVTIKQSHAGTSKQATAILQGLKADVVTFNQVSDIDILAQRGGLIPQDWASRLPNNSSPYYSTTAFLVRAGNPKQIEDWDDLTADGVGVVFPNPKTSGNGRYTYLAALGYAQDNFADEAQQQQFVKAMLDNVLVFDTGGRGATTSFVEREIGDVLITFESEVNNIKNQYDDKGFTVVVPKTSILAEFPVAWVDDNVIKNGTQETAKAYLQYLYSEEAQRLLAGFNYRVHDETVQAEFAEQFPEVKLKTIEEIAGSWPEAMQTHFASGALLDQLQR